MAFNVNTFIQNMAQDGARPNLFEIIFAEAGEKFSIRAKATALPGSSISPVGAYYFGRLVKFAGNRNFQDWTISVLVDEPDFENGPRAKLEQWMNGLNSHVGNIRDTNMYSAINYMKDGLVKQYGKGGDVIATYDMRQCFPIDIAPMPLDWGNNNTISEFNVTFAMQYWTRANITT